MKASINYFLLLVLLLTSSCSPIVKVSLENFKKLTDGSGDSGGVAPGLGPILVVKEEEVEGNFSFVVDPVNPPATFLNYTSSCSFKTTQAAASVPCVNYGGNAPNIDTVNEKITWLVSAATPKGIYTFTIHKVYSNVTLEDVISFSVNISAPFVTKWKLPANQLQMRLNPDYTYNFIIDWGDAKPPEHITTSTDISHTYDPSITEATVSIYGEFPGFGPVRKTEGAAEIDPNDRAALIQAYTDYINNVLGVPYTFAQVEALLADVTTAEIYDNVVAILSGAPISHSPFTSATLIEVVNLGAVGWKNLDYAFADQTSLTKVSGGDLSQVTSMNYTFSNNGNAELDTSTWNLANVESAVGLFRNNNININSTFSGLNFSAKLTNAAEIFMEVEGDLATLPSSLRFTGVKDMSSAFEYSIITNLDTSEWDLQNVESFKKTFSNMDCITCDFSGINVNDKALTMAGMFEKFAGFGNLNTSAWDTTNVESMENLFEDANLDGIDLSGIVVSNKNLNIKRMFASALNLTLDTTLPGKMWDTSSVVDMEAVFLTATCKTSLSCNFNRVIPSSATLRMGNAFYAKHEGIYNPNYTYIDTSNTPSIDTSLWNMINVEEAEYLFAFKDMQNSNLSGVKITDKVTSIRGMFESAHNVVLNTSLWDVSNVENASYIFENVDLAQTNLSGIVFTNKLKTASWPFRKAKNVSINTAAWDFSNVEDATDFFQSVNFLVSDLSGFVPSLKMKYMGGAFWNVSNAVIDTTKWKLSQDVDMKNLFAHGESNTLILNNLNLAAIASAESMFYGNFSNDTNIYIRGTTNEPPPAKNGHYIRPFGLASGKIYCETLTTFLELPCEPIP